MNPIARKALDQAIARRAQQAEPVVVHKSRGRTFEEVAATHPVDALVDVAKAMGVAIPPVVLEAGRALCDAPVLINRDLKNQGRRGALDVVKGLAPTVGITCTKEDIVARLRLAAEQKPPSEAAGYREVADEVEAMS